MHLQSLLTINIISGEIKYELLEETIVTLDLFYKINQ